MVWPSTSFSFYFMISFNLTLFYSYEALFLLILLANYVNNGI